MRASQVDPLLPLAVGCQAIETSRLAFDLLCQGKAGCQRQPMPQAAGGKRNVRQMVGRGMAAEPRAVFVERAQVAVTDPPDRPKRDIQRPGAVPFRQQKHIIAS